MWLFADQAAFPAAADNHGRVVHSHADGAMFYAHGGMWHQLSKEVDLQTAIASIDNEALAREAADTTLQANIDAEATTRAADDTTEANTRAGADAALSGRLDVLRRTLQLPLQLQLAMPPLFLPPTATPTQQLAM